MMMTMMKMILEFSEAATLLSDDIEIALRTEDEELINEIRSYWDNESWESIVDKFNTEGSTWIVWWSDGVNQFIKNNKE